MNIAVAGGTGFIGKVILKKLVAAGHHVKALIRQGSLLKIASISGTESRYVYYDSPSTLKKSVEDCQAIINLIGIIKQTKDNSFDYAHHLIPMSLVKAAQDSGVKRFIHMSSLGVGGELNTDYYESKHLGENVIKASGLDWTIFRPSLVYGPGDHVVSLLGRILKKTPVFPVIGDGKYKFMPVHVNNVADGFVQAIGKTESVGQTYDIAGPDSYMFDQILDKIAQAIGKKSIAKIHQPLWFVMMKAHLYGRFMPGPLTPDYIRMLIAGSVSEDDTFWKTFDTSPIAFAEGIREYLKR